MSLATLSSKDLSRIRKLIERKEALAKQVAAINREIEAVESGTPEPFRLASGAAQLVVAPEPTAAAAPVLPRKKRRAGRSARGQLKDRIGAELKSAGKQGLKVKDLADRLGTNYGNVTTFFQSTGRKMAEIKKIGPARFAWVGN